MEVFSLFASLKLKADSFYSELGRAGQVLLDFVSDSVTTGAEFDQAMSRVAAVSGATADEMDMLRKKALESSGKTKFTAQETADALNYMGMAGWKAAQMMDGLDAVMALAAAGGEDVGRTSDIITDALTAFRKPASEAQHLADVLAVAMANSNTNIHMLGESFKYAAPLAGQLNYSFEDTALALGLMANAGVKAGRAGRTINNFLTRLANSPKKARQALTNLGVSMSDAQGKMYSLRKIMIDLRTTMGEAGGGYEPERVSEYLNDTYRGIAKSLGVYDDFKQLLTEINLGYYDLSGVVDEMETLFGEDVFGWDEMHKLLSNSGYFTVSQLEKIVQLTEALGGKQALPGLLAIVGASEDEFNDLANALDNATGATEDMADTMLDNLNGAVTIFKSNLDLLKVAISDEITPSLRDFVKFGTNTIRLIKNAFQNKGFDAGLKQLENSIAGTLSYFKLNVLPGLQENGNKILDTITSILHNPLIRKNIDIGFDFVFGMVERLVTENFDVFVSYMTKIFESLFPIVKGLIKSLVYVIKNNLPEIVEIIKGIIPELGNAIKELVVSIFDEFDIGSRLKEIPVIGNALYETFDKWIGKWRSETKEAGAERELYSIFENINQWNKENQPDIQKGIDLFGQAFQKIHELKETYEDTGNKDKYSFLEQIYNQLHEVAEVKDQEVTVGIDENTANATKTNLTEIFNMVQRLKDNSFIPITVQTKNERGHGGSLQFASGMSGGKILRGSTMFGIDSYGRSLFGGESGPEAVVGVNSLSQMIQNSVRSAASSIVSAYDGSSQPVTIQLVLDSGEIISIVETEIAHNVKWKAGGRA